MSGENPDIDRRTVLRGIGAATLSAGFVGTANAKTVASQEAIRDDPFREFASDVVTDVDPETQAELVDRYRDSEIVREAFRESAGPILEELAVEGYIDSASLSAFALQSVEEDALVEPDDTATGAGVTAIERAGEASAHLTITTESADHRVALYHQPELGTTYAAVRGDDGDLIVHDMGDDGVSTAKDCAWEAEYCTGSICQTGDPAYCTEQQAYCCYGPNWERSCSDTRYVCDCICD